MTRRARRLAALGLLLAAGGCAPRQLQSDWEREHLQNWQEEDVSPPMYPSAAGLIEVPVPDANGFRFFVDGRTLSIGDDGVVRYVLVARSPSGAQNVSFEGLRCATREYRIYAVGHAEHRWSGRPTAWQGVGAASGAAPWRTLLQRDYLCRGKEPVRDAAEGVRSLRQGKPWYRDAD